MNHRMVVLLMTFLGSSGILHAQPAPTTAAAGQMRVQSDFPGGSAVVQSIDQATHTIRIAPAGTPERGFVCWWYFKLEGVEIGTDLTLEIAATGWGRPERAQYSYDNRTWLQTEPGVMKSRTLEIYHHKAQANTIWFAWGPPFVLRDANELIDDVCKRSPYAVKFDLATTRGGRTVPAVSIRQPSDVAAADRFGVWVQARHHAWESGSSWVARGFIQWLISQDPQATALRQHADIYFVPIMDVDSVETGMGGKDQKPHDHQFDWGADPIYPEVRAAMQKIGSLQAAGRFHVFVDLHNPGADAREVLFYTPAKPLLVPERLKHQEAFLELAKQELTGDMAFTGKLGPQGETYTPAADPSAECWVANNGGLHVVSLTMETPWNTPSSTQAGYQKKGEQLGRTIERYLRGPVRP